MSENENEGIITPSTLISIKSFEVRQSMFNDENDIIFYLYDANQNLLVSFELAPPSAASMVTILRSGQCGYNSETKYIHYPI